MSQQRWIDIPEEVLSIYNSGGRRLSAGEELEEALKTRRASTTKMKE